MYFYILKFSGVYYYVLDPYIYPYIVIKSDLLKRAQLPKSKDFLSLFRGIRSILWPDEHDASGTNDDGQTRRPPLRGDGILPSTKQEIATCARTTLQLQHH